MHFALTEEQHQFRRTIYDWARAELLPESDKQHYDDNSDFIWENWKKLGEMGLIGLPFPEEYGGSDGGCMNMVLAAEAVAAAGVDSGTVLSWGAHTILCGVPLWQLGTEEQKRKYLPRLASGEIVTGWGLTEPEAGSDAGSLKCRAVRDGDHYVLNGVKTFITNGPIGDLFLVMVSTAPEQKAMGISAILVEKGTPGFSTSKKFDKLGNRTSPTSELIFEDCRVPAENLLGQENMGFFEVGKLILEWERSCLLASGVGCLEHWLYRTAKYTLDRKQFKRPIAHFEETKRKLARMRMLGDATRMAVYRVAAAKDAGDDAFVEACTAKLFGSEAVEWVMDKSLQLYGGYGYMKEYQIERFWRDGRLSTIGAGTSEIQRGIIAKGMGM